MYMGWLPRALTWGLINKDQGSLRLVSTCWVLHSFSMLPGFLPESNAERLQSGPELATPH